MNLKKKTEVVSNYKKRWWKKESTNS